MLKLNLQSKSIDWSDLKEMIMPRKFCLHEWNLCPYEKDPRKSDKKEQDDI